MILRLRAFQKININVFFKDLIFIFLTLYLLPNDYKYYFKGLEILLNLSILIFFTYVLIIKSSAIKFAFINYWYIILIYMISLISSINYNTFYAGAIKNLISIMTISLMIGVYFYKDEKKYLKLIERISFIILFINVILFVIFKEPLRYTDTGGRVYFIFEGSVYRLFFLNLISFLTINHFSIINRCLHIGIYIVTIYFIYVTSSTTTILILMIFIFYLLLIRFKIFKEILKRYKVLIICLFILTALVISGRFSSLLSVMFDKSMSLSGRTIIWEKSLSLFFKHPIFGIGVISPSDLISFTGVKGATHTHNAYIGMLLSSGTFGFSLFCILFYKLRNLKYVLSQKKYQYYLGYLFAMLIGSITANYIDSLFYIYTFIILKDLKYNIHYYKTSNKHFMGKNRLKMNKVKQ